MVALHRFYLSQEEILEMRMNFYNNAVFINGYLQFRVYEFVTLINQIIARNNIFQRLNKLESDKRRTDMDKARKDRSEG